MKIFSDVVDAIASLPAWVPLILCPALLIVCAVLCMLFGGRRAYPAVAVCLGAFGALECIKNGALAFAYAALFAALAALLALLFLLPRLPLKKRKKESREDKIYRRFHEELSAPPAEGLPPKVCCYEEAPVSAEESGMRLTYVTSLLGKLKSGKLTPADRLEVEVLTRTVDAYRGKPLTEEELSVLNDCLASVLKLTAKYKL